MSKLENYIKIILKKFKKKFKKKKITLTSQDIINKYNDQYGYCSITKHKMTHMVDKKGRTDASTTKVFGKPNTSPFNFV